MIHRFDLIGALAAAALATGAAASGWAHGDASAPGGATRPAAGRSADGSIVAAHGDRLAIAWKPGRLSIARTSSD